MRKFVVLLVLVSMSVVGITANTSTRVKNAPHQFDVSLPQPVTTSVRIDGAKKPELISDRAAYSMLFRLISNRKADLEKERIRSHIRKGIGLGNQMGGKL